jgi:hypothetical protein
VRPNASENEQISPTTTVPVARGVDSRPHLASILQEGRKSINIHAGSGVIWGIPGKIMKHLEVVFLAVIVVIYPFLFAIIYEMRHIRRRSRDLPLFPAPSDSLSRRLKFRILESYGYAYNQLFQAKE